MTKPPVCRAATIRTGVQTRPGLLLAVVDLHVNLLTSHHSEMASDIKRFASNSELCFGALFKLDVN